MAFDCAVVRDHGTQGCSLWPVAFPLWQGPDEDDHFAVIQFVAEMGRLPDEGDEFLPDEVTLSREIADVGRLDYNPNSGKAFSNSATGPNEAEFAYCRRNAHHV